MAKSPKPQSLEIVADGDSWFNLPDFWSSLPIVGGVDNDLVRALQARGHTVANLAHWGHTIEQMAKDRDYRGLLRNGEKNIFILSGGGNDLLGAKFGNVGQLQFLLNQKPSGEDPPASFYLNQEFFLRVDQILAFHRSIFRDIADDPQMRRTRTFVHGYDFAKPKRLAWIEDPMDFRNVPDKHKQALVDLMINHFNKRLAATVKDFPNVTYVDLRDTVKGRWHDEIHPVAAAFDDLAAKFEKAILKAL